MSLQDASQRARSWLTHEEYEGLASSVDAADVALQQSRVALLEAVRTVKNAIARIRHQGEGAHHHDVEVEAAVNMQVRDLKDLRIRLTDHLTWSIFASLASVDDEEKRHTKEATRLSGLLDGRKDYDSKAELTLSRLKVVQALRGDSGDAGPFFEEGRPTRAVKKAACLAEDVVQKELRGAEKKDIDEEMDSFAETWGKERTEEASEAAGKLQ